MVTVAAGIGSSCEGAVPPVGIIGEGAGPDNGEGAVLASGMGAGAASGICIASGPGSARSVMAAVESLPADC